MSRTLLIRHAAPKIDPAVSAKDWVLSDAGIAASEALAVKLLPFELKAITTSPEPKAHQTASVIGSYLGVPVRTDLQLREHERSSAGFLPRAAFEEGIARVFAQPDRVAFGDESADEVFIRISHAIERVRAEGYATAAVATHGTAMSIYVSRVTGIDALTFWQALVTPTAVMISGRDIVRVA